MNARQSCVCDIKSEYVFFEFEFIYLFVNLIYVCETKIYLWISFYLSRLMQQNIYRYLWLYIYIYIYKLNI